MRVAALVATHNRREKTLRCLETLDEAASASEVELLRVIVDDGSTDGTWEALQALRRPKDVFLRGSGSLYWAGAMRYAMIEGRRVLNTVDHILLLNDDTELLSSALSSMLACAGDNRDRIVVGTVCDPTTGERTYGGLRRKSRGRPLTFVPVPQMAGQMVDAMNANAALVGRNVFSSLGPFDSRYTHSLADFDYALLARRLGFTVCLAADVVGHCRRNAIDGTWLDSEQSLRIRWQRLRQPKGLPPAEWLHYCWKNARILGVPYVASPYFHLLSSSKRPRPTMSARLGVRRIDRN